MFVLGGYLDGRIPPGINDFSKASLAIENLLRAHVEASFLLRERNPGARFGIAHNMMDFAAGPARLPGRTAGSPPRRTVSTTAHYLEAAVTGRLDMRIPMIGRVRLPFRTLPARRRTSSA